MKKTLSGLVVVAGMLMGAGNALAGPPMAGGGCFFYPTSLVPAVGPNGEEGRSVFFPPGSGTIVGENFEPGQCEPYPGALSFPDNPFGGKCLFFTKSTPRPDSGEFQRAHPGQTAFTYCRECTIDGRTGNFTLKISYPNPKSFSDPNASPFTKFTIQDADGGLAGLKGQGTLDFTNGCYTMRYHFEN
jgi:hypothetical protein